ncbi:kinase-like domain-containing protein [Chaetomium fimeti]|uniref:Kinase-like domain-containing protein n=1 Tax=Chaetomium fimeti TaxID=1854472 RepID=A0AAE0HH33_9PEZI|nr:kinase-like domain-containing protein [Chaetomium fimeti]
MASLLRWATGLYRRAPLPPRSFANLRYETIPESLKIEEETLPDYLPQRFYPVRLGEVLASRYQVVAKLGYGVTSTVWLARDLNQHRHVAVKAFVRAAAMGSRLNHERNVYQRINNGPRSHPGRDAVRSLLDAFQLEGPDGEHQCLVHPPLWVNLQTFLDSNPVGRLPNPVLAVVLYRLFQGLDYLHSECGIIHTDIKPDNIMFGFNDDSPLAEFEQAELDSPSPRKEVNGRVIYVTRQIPMPKSLGPPVLCDFGAAVFGDKLHDDDVQPDQYRCPEVILEIPWSYKIDVWNIGCLVWDLFEGGHLFHGTDPEHGVYRGRAHLAEMIALLGPPTPELINRGNLKAKFFSKSCEWKAGIEPLPPVSLEKLEMTLEGADKQLFLQLMKKLLQWAPEDRMAPRELIKDPWVVKHLFG